MSRWHNYIARLIKAGRRGFNLMEIQIGVVLGMGAVAVGAGWFFISMEGQATGRQEAMSASSAQVAAREVLNGLSNSTNAAGSAAGPIAYMDGWDLIVRARKPEDGSTHFVRWCTTARSGQADLMEVTASTAAATGTGGGPCGAPPGAQERKLAKVIVPNGVPVFTYDSTSADQVKVVAVSLSVGPNAADAGKDKPGSAVINAAGTLQENERAPVASVAASGLRADDETLVLDARQSTDPDGQPLKYEWRVSGLSSGTEKYQGARLELDASERTSARPTICLTVTDAKGLTSTQVVEAPNL